MLTVLGSKSAVKNMSPGQIVFASIAALVISSIILLNAGLRIGTIASGAVPVGIFLGCGVVVGGMVLLAGSAKRHNGGRRVGLIAGAVLCVIGACVTVGALASGISAG